MADLRLVKYLPARPIGKPPTGKNADIRQVFLPGNLDNICRSGENGAASDHDRSLSLTIIYPEARKCSFAKNQNT